MTPNHKRLIDAGWYRMHYGWWHPSRGQEPEKGLGMRKALELLESMESANQQFVYRERT